MIAPGGSFAVKIHFQPDGAPVPAGYLKDDGALFGPKPSGFTYGWNIVHTDFTRQRNHNPDPRLDSFCHFHAGGKWELEVPNGSYVVTISIGEPDNPSTNTLIVDGIEFCRHVNLPTNTFSRMVKTVPVTAGRLTVSQGSEPDKTTRIDYIEVVSAGTVDAGIGSH
jgi:hypothetical protein